ncbi:MAG: hypothetical protein AAGI53_01810 [Planctomycetota bacterium]
MPKRRQLVLIKLENPDDRLSATVPLGSTGDFVKAVSAFNTAPDGGAGKRMGTEVLHGPGMVVEIPAGQSEIRQALVTCTEQDLAWPVLRGICSATGWKLQDMESGQMFG